MTGAAANSGSHDDALRRYWGVRKSVAMSRPSAIVALHVSGEDALAALDAQCAGDLYLLDGQLRHTLMLGEDGRPVVDLYVGRDDESYLLLAEGLDAAALAARLQSGGQDDLEVVDLGTTHGLLQFDGPFAWELSSALLGTEVATVPFQTFMHVDGGFCFRAGKTGEFGYLFLLEPPALERFTARALELGPCFDLEQVELDVLDRCALESGFFSIRNALPAGSTPIELQQQWRVSSRKTYVGSEALAQRRREGARFRSTAVCSPQELRIGDVVRCDELEIGTIYATSYSPALARWVGAAALSPAYAYPGVQRYHIVRDGASISVETRSLPLLNNYSLHVDPRRHSYATRDEIALPELALEVVG